MESEAVECREGDFAEMLESVDAERQRIARELHDAVGQELVAAALFAAGLQKILERAHRRSQSSASPRPGHSENGFNGHLFEADSDHGACSLSPAETSQLLETLSGIRRALAAASRSVRDLSHGLLLTEIDPGELPGRLEELRQSLETARSVHCEIECLQPGQPGFEHLNSQRALQLLRIVQEAVNNAIRHGGANQLRVSLRGDTEHLELEVADNGRGIADANHDCSPAPFNGGSDGGIGLRNMAYRARHIGGLLQIGCSSDGGTVVRCRVEPQESRNG
ncbi:MAG: sensor histidine kinase [Planctomycetota bacterium]